MRMAWLTVLGIPAGVYVASITALMFYVSQTKQNPLILLAVGVMTVGIYMFHRTAITANDQLQPRHRIALLHTSMLRKLSWVLLLLASGLFALHHPIAVLLVVGSLFGVIVYGRNILSKPARNNTYVKPIAVGTSITLFAWVLNDFSNTVPVFFAFVSICTADALLCDLVDCAYDKASGCHTLASSLRSTGTWLCAGFLTLVGAALLLSPVGWIVLGLFPFLFLSQKILRTAVDIRPCIVLLLAWSL
jgi:4-hydroxybenzoate polyprenyltransferase